MWRWGTGLCQLAGHKECNPESTEGLGGSDLRNVSFGDSGVLSSGTDMTHWSHTVILGTTFLLDSILANDLHSKLTMYLCTWIAVVFKAILSVHIKVQQEYIQFLVAPRSSFFLQI
ncbi:hypothetical protein SERLA73DRAFT_152760 [Serpula lacrymans var. lacrymans S7.3]|uniref:Uncharacterized protein n=1 Tax=Serpula lacrymans var. lacrymans (strain S7.3) TaxID=936435 RepID=F8PYQ9_SERL3|nr:hypothetical protein SERLA73DRAFT_152760 [Serpula lacrymans var. lacrymans S7.3]